MSLKTIELQVALPRTFEAGKLSEQITQRSQLANDYASLEMERKREHEKNSVKEMEQKDKTLLENGLSSSKHNQSGNEMMEQKDENKT